jgi:hypothetical protein
MKEKEAIKKLVKYCEDNPRYYGWWIFRRRLEVTLEETRLLKTHERSMNVKLPEFISYPRDTGAKEGLIIDARGVRMQDSEIGWGEIEMTVIKTELLSDGESGYAKRDRYLLLLLNDGKIVEQEIKDFGQYREQIGDLIEQYKLEFSKNKVP